MTFRDQLVRQLVADEGLQRSAYQDSLGFWTIGVGRLIDARKGGGITIPEAYLLLDHDIDNAIKDITTRYPWFETLDPVRQAVLVNMAFNLGIRGLAGFVNTLKAIQRGDYDAGSVGMLASAWASQVGARALRLAEQMRTGIWVQR